MEFGIEAEGLKKRYGAVTALDGFDIAVPRGSVAALLGPNGAGKTTVVRILTTLVKPDGGSARVAGHDVVTEAGKLRRQIGLSGQNAAVDEILNGYENLEMVARLYGLSSRDAKERARELIERFDLTEAGRRQVKTYSGGMRRRLDLAAALVVRPPVIFLDEPTTGLDPRARNEMWDMIRELVAAGSTLLLTTQYLEEADQLANEITVVDRGRVIARGTADELKRQVGGERLVLTVADAEAAATAVRALAPVAVGEPDVNAESYTLTVPVTGGASVLQDGLRLLDDAGVRLLDIGLRRPSLDDVFLSLTGHKTEVPQDTKKNKKKDSGRQAGKNEVAR